VNDGVLELIEIFESLDNLHDYRFGFLLRDFRMLLEINIQVVSFAVFQDRAETRIWLLKENQEETRAPATCLPKTGLETGFLARNKDRLLDRLS
jgi:hypothetical protein